jgi:hypothetical protein
MCQLKEPLQRYRRSLRRMVHKVLPWKFQNGSVKDIYFKIILHNKELPFRLPAKAERVYQSLWGEKQEWEQRRYGEGWRQQAERIAWRICKTWLEAQITLINLEQAKLEEVFLPYLVMPSNKTLFEKMEHNQFLLPDKRAA